MKFAGDGPIGDRDLDVAAGLTEDGEGLAIKCHRAMAVGVEQVLAADRDHGSGRSAGWRDSSDRGLRCHGERKSVARLPVHSHNQVAACGSGWNGDVNLGIRPVVMGSGNAVEGDGARALRGSKVSSVQNDDREGCAVGGYPNMPNYGMDGCRRNGEMPESKAGWVGQLLQTWSRHESLPVPGQTTPRPGCAGGYARSTSSRAGDRSATPTSSSINRWDSYACHNFRRAFRGQRA
jgi:hypothetical protein